MNLEKIQSNISLLDVSVPCRWIAHKEQTLDAPYPSTFQHRILCVDDELVASKLRKEMIEGHGYAVDLYHCPLAVLQRDLSIFSLAVIDFRMPGLNGRDLLLRMRALGGRFPIVLLTGDLAFLSSEDRVLFTRCLDKIKPPRCLLETIDEFLGPKQIPDFGS